MKSLHLLQVFLLDIIIIVAAQTTTSSSTLAGTTSDTPATATSKGNRITYAQLPSCASACVASAVRSVPCTPFVASCFCALPTGRRAYELPIECVKEKCGKEDVEAQETWRADVCAGFTETTVIPPPTGIRESSVTLSQSTAPEATESCGNGWKGCPVGLNGGCCPRSVAEFEHQRMVSPGVRAKTRTLVTTSATSSTANPAPPSHRHQSPGYHPPPKSQ